MSIKKEAQQELAQRLVKSLKRHTEQEIAEAYGVKTPAMSRLIDRISEKKVHPSTITRLNLALDKLEGKE